AVTSWLSSTGLTVTGVEPSHHYISVRGTVAAAQQAFGVSVGRYSHDGQNVQAPAGQLTVPTSIAGQVLTVTGLDTTRRANTSSATSAASTPPPPTGFDNARPCSMYYAQIRATYQADYRTKLP